MLGAAGTPALLAHGRGDWVLGGLAAGLLVAAGVSAPFLTAAVALVGGGVVGTNLLVMAVGFCGLVTTASATARTRRLPAFCGVALLVVAGVPATLPRALAAVVGLLLILSAHRPSAPDDDDDGGVPA
jgi:alanine dehydrogenase